MRKVVATEYLTLDGIMEEPGQWSFQFWTEEAAQFKSEELFAADALLLGRVTYEGFAAAWPNMPDTGDFGVRMNTLPKYVVSTTLDTAEWNNSTIIKEQAVEEISRLKQQPGQDILLEGSGTLVRSLIPHNLIDEYRLMVHPIMLGNGRRLFHEGMPKTILKMVGSKSFSSGVVVLTYQPAEQKEQQ